MVMLQLKVTSYRWYFYILVTLGFRCLTEIKHDQMFASIYQRCRLEVNSLCIVIWKFHFPSFLLQFRSWKISEKLVLWQQTRTGQIRSTWWICSFTSYLNKTTALKAPLQSEPHFSNLFPSHLPLFDICSRVTFIVQLCVLRASLPVGAWYELIQVDSVLDHHRLFSMKYISMYFLIKIRFIIN